MKRIEDANGRSRQGPRFSARTLDIDILLVGICAVSLMACVREMR